MADVKKPAPPPRSKVVGVKAYHDYRIGRVSTADCCKTERPPVPKPACGAGKGFKGF